MSKSVDIDQETDPGREAQEEEAAATERFGGGGHKMLLIGYLGLLALVALALWALLNAGGGLKPPGPSGGPPPDPRSEISAEKILWHLLLAGIVILIASRVVGGLLRRVHQPHVIGEIIAGILLGPSLLGAIWPQAGMVPRGFRR